MLDALGIARVAVYGFQTGNKIATCMARRAPARVSALVLSGQTHSLMPIYRANCAFDLGAPVAALAIPPHVVEVATPAEEHYGRQAEPLAALCPGGGTTTFENTGSDAHEIRAAALSALLIARCVTS